MPKGVGKGGLISFVRLSHKTKNELHPPEILLSTVGSFLSISASCRRIRWCKHDLRTYFTAKNKTQEGTPRSTNKKQWQESMQGFIVSPSLSLPSFSKLNKMMSSFFTWSSSIVRASSKIMSRFRSKIFSGRCEERRNSTRTCRSRRAVRADRSAKGIRESR